MRRFRNREKIGERIAAGACLFGIFFGIFLVKQMEEYFLERAGLISDYCFRQLPYMEYEAGKLVRYFFGKRMKWAVLLIAAAYVRTLILCIGCMAGWAGFSLGFLGTIAVVKFGMKGIVMIFLGAMPQGIFYVWGMWKIYQSLKIPRFVPVSKLLGGLGILFLGILTESYVNQYCLKWIYHLL